MAQKRFHNYQRPVDSFQENERLLGMFEPGRYRGFDGLTNISGLTADVGHSGSGIVKTNADNVSTSNSTGVWVSKIGSIIHEDSPIAALVFGTNASNPYERIDAIYGEHQWLASPGGQAATYGIIQGANGGAAYPTVSNPLTQVILGYIHIPASAANLSAATYEPAIIPNLGNADIIVNNPGLDLRYAQLDAENVFTKFNSWGAQTAPDVTASKQLVLGDGGNLVAVNFSSGSTVSTITSKPDGSLVTLYFAGAATLEHNAVALPGFLKIRNSTGLNYVLPSGGTFVLLEKLGTAWYIIASSRTLNDIISIQSALSANSLAIANLQTKVTPVNGIIMYDGAIGGNFDSSGLGINNYLGWAVCNGENGTPDLRGRFIVGAINGMPGSGSVVLDAAVDPTTPYEGVNPPNYSVGSNGGKPHHKLDVAELPAHHHEIKFEETNAGPSGGGYNLGRPSGANTDNTTDTGGGSAHQNLPPYYALIYIKRLN